MPGYQYELDPAARRLLDDVFGLRGVPTYVECTRKRVGACRRTLITENLETNTKHTTVTEEPGQEATFRYVSGHSRFTAFTLDLPALVRARAAMTPAELHKEDRYVHTDERPESRKGRKAKIVVNSDVLFGLD